MNVVSMLNKKLTIKFLMMLTILSMVLVISPVSAEAATTRTITVHTVGDRDAGHNPVPLLGATFTAYSDSNLTTNVGSCITIANGTCTIDVPKTDVWVKETISPTNYSGPTTLTSKQTLFSPATSYPYIDKLNNGFLGYGRESDTRNFVNSRVNPNVTKKCGLKVALLFDRSLSISNAEGTALKNSTNALVDALSNTQSEVSVASFGTTATQNLAMTPITDVAGVTTVKNSINNLNIGYALESTNWDGAFWSQVNSSADVVVVMTDGSPKVHNLNGSGGFPLITELDDVEAGILSANSVKASGKRIIAVGIGNESNIATDNIQAISGPTLNDDHFLASNFTALNSQLQDLATINCVGSVTVTKEVKNSDGTYTPTNGWDYTSTNAIDNTQTTAGQGTAVFNYNKVPKTTTINETVKPGYSIESITCLKNDEPIGTVSGSAVSLTVNIDDAITCTFKNVRDTGTLQIKKIAKEADGTFGFTSNSVLGEFSLKTVDGVAQSDVTTVNTGTYNISEFASINWAFNGVSCTGATNTGEGSTVTINVTKGSNVVCTFTNTRDTFTLQVIENSIGGDGTFPFSVTESSPLIIPPVPVVPVGVASIFPVSDLNDLNIFSLLTVGGTKQTSAISIPTGKYDITQAVPSGWSLTDLNCTGGATTSTAGNTITINGTTGQNIVCSFSNTKEVQVLGTFVTRPIDTPVIVAGTSVERGSLPLTGTEITSLILFGICLIIGGVMFFVSCRRKNNTI